MSPSMYFNNKWKYLGPTQGLNLLGPRSMKRREDQSGANDSFLIPSPIKIFSINFTLR